MEGSTYKIIEIIGTSDTSWGDAARTAIETADEHVRDLRIAEVKKLDVTIKDGKIKSYRARLDLSFKYYKIIRDVKTPERSRDLYSDW
ncbi:dodecin family protein [Thermodesulfobacteriota bacterium]